MPNKSSNNRYSAEFKSSIVSLHKTGRSANSLSKEYNVSVSTVTKWINQANPNNTKVLSDNERALIKENHRLKEELDILKRAAVLLAKKLMAKGRAVVLEIVQASLQANHRIIHILRTLKIPRSTYYSYRHWQPSKTACRRQLIKQQLLSLWLKYPMYGYPRLTVALYQILGLKVSQWLVYHLMKELEIRSRMVRKISKPKIHTEYPQRPNLIRDLADQTRVLVTDITYIPLQRSWLYGSYDVITDNLFATIISKESFIMPTNHSHLFVRNLDIRAS